MAAVLLDVNVLVALFSEDHSHHIAAQKWLREHEKKGWAMPEYASGICETAFQSVLAGNAVPPPEAIAVLEENTSTPHHEFWSDDIPYAKAIEPIRSKLSGHRQITDAYLLGLAMHRQGRLATFDRSIAALLPEGKRKADWIVELST